MKPPPVPDLNRITLRSIGGYILEQLNLERGLGYAVRRLLIDPHGAIREFLFEDRSRMMKPLPLLLLVVGVATFMSFHFLHLEEELKRGLDQEITIPGLPAELLPKAEPIITFLQQYFNLALMSTIPFTALGSFLMFRKQGLFYAEHLVINTYTYSIQTLMVILFIPLFPLFQFSRWLAILLTLVAFAYLSYAYTRIFEQRWLPGILKALAVYFFSQILYDILALFVIMAIALLS